MAKFYIALQHFGNEDGKLGNDGKDFWFVNKVCSTRPKAEAYDDGDPDSDEFKVVGFETIAYGPDADAALAERYGEIADFIYANLDRYAALHDGELEPEVEQG